MPMKGCGEAAVKGEKGNPGNGWGCCINGGGPGPMKNPSVSAPAAAAHSSTKPSGSSGSVGGGVPSDASVYSRLGPRIGVLLGRITQIETALKEKGWFASWTHDLHGLLDRLSLCSRYSGDYRVNACASALPPGSHANVSCLFGRDKRVRVAGPGGGLEAGQSPVARSDTGLLELYGATEAQALAPRPRGGGAAAGPAQGPIGSFPAQVRLAFLLPSALCVPAVLL